MPCCATDGCDDPRCLVCTVCIRFPEQFRPQLAEASELRDDAPALNGTKPRPSRDPRFTKRNRKPLTK